MKSPYDLIFAVVKSHPVTEQIVFALAKKGYVTIDPKDLAVETADCCCRGS